MLVNCVNCLQDVEVPAELLGDHFDEDGIVPYVCDECEKERDEAADERDHECPCGCEGDDSRCVYTLSWGKKTMKIPLGFLEDSKRANHWHISNSKGALCGAEDSGTDWHLPDESFQKINLCLDCWEVLSESAAEHPDPTLHDLQENNWGEGDGS